MSGIPRSHSFKQLCASDLRNGLFVAGPRLLVCTALMWLLCLIANIDAHSGLTSVPSLNFGDYFAALFAGASEHDPADNRPFPLPTAWICLFALLAFVTLDYPLRDLNGIGAHMAIASGSRWRWWLSKCLWVTVCVCTMWLASIAVCIGWALASGGSLDLNLTTQIADALKMPHGQIAQSDSGLLGPLLLLPFALLAILMIQLTVSLLLRPVLGFATSIALLYVSAFTLSPFLIGNYLMVIRSNLVIANGVPVFTGFLLSLALIFASVVIGGILFNRFDIVGREADGQ